LLPWPILLIKDLQSIYIVDILILEWDPRKDVSNQRKHGISFMSEINMKTLPMRKNYDFSKSVPNPYAKRRKKQITIRLDEGTIAYFKDMAEEKGIPYQSLINLYLRDCAESRKKVEIEWN
jgi:predicted DNA binding CopG/RHH family protein